MLGSLFGFFTLQTLLSGIIASVISTLAMFGLNWFKDRSLTKHKEELARESGRLTNEMVAASNHTLERLRMELAQSTEAYKLALRKKEWLFDKELESVNAFLKWRGQYIPTPVGPAFDIEAAAQEMVSQRFQIEAPMRELITAHTAVLPPEIRNAMQAAYRHFADSLIRANLHDGAVERNLAKKALEKLIEDVDGVEQSLVNMIRS